MSMRLVLGALLSYFMSVFSVQALGGETNPTLCEAYEEIYFSCPLLNGKIVSVCAADNFNPESGYVQYRYGSPENIELVYPKSELPPVGRFFIVDASQGSANKGIIKFKNGGYTYIVAQAFVGFLTVLKNDKVVLRASCDEGRNAFVSPAATKGIESIPVSPEDFR